MKGIKCKDFEIRTNYRACLKLIIISVQLVKYRITMAGLALLMLMAALHDKIKFQKSYRFEKQIKQKQISYVIETLYLNWKITSKLQLKHATQLSNFAFVQISIMTFVQIFIMTLAQILIMTLMQISTMTSGQLSLVTVLRDNRDVR